jgi:hypothetical protein
VIYNAADHMELLEVGTDKLTPAFAAQTEKIARLQAVEVAARELTTTGFFWWSDGDDDRITYRCLGCDVDRDDIQSGVDKHHPSCRVGKLAAALTQPGDADGGG